MLSITMLDDGNNSISAKQFDWGVVWTQRMNGEAWNHVLGPGHGGNVSELQSPARATDLSGVAPAFIDVGECDVFRDEAVAYASQIWKSGSSAELHVWPGRTMAHLSWRQMCRWHALRLKRRRITFRNCLGLGRMRISKVTLTETIHTGGRRCALSKYLDDQL